MGLMLDILLKYREHKDLQQIRDLFGNIDLPGCRPRAVM